MSNLPQNLGAQRCCSIPFQGPMGPPGPTGIGFIGPMGVTGPTGASLTGPTGRGCFGPTGPIGSSMGPTGPTGPSTNNFINTSIQPASYNIGTSTITLPIQSNVICYYNVDITNGNLTIINPNNLLPGYKAILCLTTSSITTLSVVNISNTNNVQVNLNNTISLIAQGSSMLQASFYYQYAVITIISDGTYFYANVVGVTNQQLDY